MGPREKESMVRFLMLLACASVALGLLGCPDRPCTDRTSILTAEDPSRPGCNADSVEFP